MITNNKGEPVWRKITRHPAKKNLEGITISEGKKELISFQGLICERCSKEVRTKSQLELDHIKPICLGGQEFSMSNFQMLCIPCHRKKSLRDRKILKEFKVVIGSTPFWHTCLSDDEINQYINILGSLYQQKTVVERYHG